MRASRFASCSVAVAFVVAVVSSDFTIHATSANTAVRHTHKIVMTGASHEDDGTDEDAATASDSSIYASDKVIVTTKMPSVVFVPRFCTFRFNNRPGNGLT